MKILWLANTPCGAREKLAPGHVNGGWLVALEAILVKNPKIDLNIGFYWGENISSFKYNKTTYHPILREGDNSKLGRLFNRAFLKNNDSKEITRLLKIIEEVQPDIIHVHGTENNFGLIQEHTKIPVLISIQGILSPYTEKYFSGIPKNIIKKHESFAVKLKMNSSKAWYNRMIANAHRERQILGSAKYIMGRTTWDKRVTQILAPNSKYFVGQEMLREAFFEKSWKINKKDKKFRILTTTTGNIYKGLETLVKAAEILSVYANIDFEWLVVGLENNDSYPKAIKRWLKIDFDKFNIKLLGKKDEYELVDLMTNVDLYCQVSHIENSPNSLCEAMLLGMPCIASFAGGTDSILENGKEGILIQDGDPYSLAGTIKSLYKNYETIKTYSENSKARALKRHDSESIVTCLLTVYRQIILKNEV